MNRKKKEQRVWRRRIGAAAFWLAVWQAAALIWKDSLVFVGPAAMLASLARQLVTGTFWISVGNSSLHIAGGFLTAFAGAFLLAGAAYRLPLLEALLEPVIAVQKSVPVASFVVLLLLLAGAGKLSFLIVILMAFPILYTNIKDGLRQADPAMLEMAAVFEMPLWNRLRFIYRPALWPHLMSGAKIAAGMSWKAGVAAELIGIPDRSVGERLYMAKIYLDTESLFAWTLVIIVLGAVSERLLLKGLEGLAPKSLGGKNGK